MGHWFEGEVSGGGSHTDKNGVIKGGDIHAHVSGEAILIVATAAMLIADPALAAGFKF